MKQTWRWFGSQDPVSISDMLQAGVQGVVTALHHVPTGEVWDPDQIAARQAKIASLPGSEASGLTWDVVESLPVSEDIKRQTGNWRDHIAAYKTSLQHIADAGIEVVCYNFMPVLDWTRTDLASPRPDGATCMRYDQVDFAAFDLFILERLGAVQDIPQDVAEAAHKRFAEMDEKQREALAKNVVCGLPGAASSFSLDQVREQIALYDNVGKDQLRQNFIDFLTEVVPVAEQFGLRLCCHPDDPPFDLLGLPRIMSTASDYDAILNAVDSPANGMTFCTGSLGARSDNDLPAMMDHFGDKVHFLHLRNVTCEDARLGGSFHEARHLEGGTDMVAVIAAVLREEARRKAAGRADAVIPMRPDHGQDILDDLERNSQPGYPAIGRLKGLAELRGIEAALSHAQFGMNL